MIFFLGLQRHLGMNDHGTATAQGIDFGHRAIDIGDDRLPFRFACLEEFDHAQQATDLLLHHLHHLLDLPDAFAFADLRAQLHAPAVHVVQNLLQRAHALFLHVGDTGQILAGDAAGMEGAHRQLGARLADGLRGDDPRRFADFDHAPGRQVAAITHGANPLAQFAG